MLKLLLTLLLIGLVAVGCNSSNGAPTMIVGTPLPTFSGVVQPPVTGVMTIPAAVTQPGPVPTPPSVADGWTAVTGAVYTRQLTMVSQSRRITVIGVRIDPGRATFKVYYTPGQLHTLPDWKSALGSPTVIVNGNYYDANSNAIGLVVSNDNSYGGYVPRNDSGFFQVRNNSPRVRQLWAEPYNPNETFQQAMQGFPILTAQGQTAPINPDLDQKPARRTVIAQDKYGRILIFITPTDGTTLAEMANWVTKGGMDILTALNFDGGGSTQMMVGSQMYTGVNPIPLVLAVYSN